MAELSTRTVDRATDLLAAVSQRGEATLTECARAVDLAPSTALRLLRTLEVTGFVRRDDSGVFRPGDRLIQIGAQALSHESLVSLSDSSLRLLASQTGESSYLGVRTAENGVLYIAQAEGSRSIRHVSWVGHRFPADDSASGLALRGEVGAGGYVHAASVVEPDVTAVAAPVSSPQGVVAAMSVVGPTYRLDDDHIRRLGDLVLAEAERVSARLGAPAPTDPSPSSSDESDPS